MLILTRKLGQSLIIGDGIEVSIVDVSGDKVKVGISAPKDVKILRSELAETMEVNKIAAESRTDRSVLELLANRSAILQIKADNHLDDSKEKK
ncbi:MAG: carbon storage regulator CsrA [Clostridiales bacterium]|nr:carbon storage regulator CsrA [Clostridiales bacterium]